MVLEVDCRARGFAVGPDECVGCLFAHHRITECGERHERVFAGDRLDESRIGERAHEAVEVASAFFAKDAVGAELVEPGADDFL